MYFFFSAEFFIFFPLQNLLIFLFNSFFLNVILRIVFNLSLNCKLISFRPHVAYVPTFFPLMKDRAVISTHSSRLNLCTNFLLIISDFCPATAFFSPSHTYHYYPIQVIGILVPTKALKHSFPLSAASR